jgi:site-specific DNA recombinase
MSTFSTQSRRLSGSEQAARKPALIRCAIYTRKSSEEGLEQEFNSLDAQRESGEAYIASQKAEGWVCLPDKYDDGGYTGGNMDRPAVQKLMADIDAGKVDCVVVYKVDRLSRSLMDFARLMELFDRKKISFVSVTQQFNTTQSMGRLTLNILLSFAQFEREIISERTRDKIAATRRKGKWFGGKPILGYDLVEGKLVVNRDEAYQVREMYAIYLDSRSVRLTTAEVALRGWKTKAWTQKDGTKVGGLPLTNAYMHRILTSVSYLGKVQHHDQVYEGEQEAIIDPALWMRVQAVLEANGRDKGSDIRNVHHGLLKGLVRCGHCDKPMGHTFTTKAGKRTYRYYVCHVAQSSGYHACPSKSVPAEQLESFVVDRLQALGRDRELVDLILERARWQSREVMEQLKDRRATLEREIRWLASDERRAGAASDADRLADLAERTRQIAAQVAEIDEELIEAEQATLRRDQVDAAFAEFRPLWDQLSTRERTELIRSVIKAVEFDGKAGEVTLVFHPELSRLAQENA